MHEFSLIRSLLKQVTAIKQEHGASAVERIRVQIGPLSGVERELVELAFAQEVDSTPCQGAELEIEVIALTVDCRSCGTQTEVVDFHFQCALCSSTDVVIASGDQFLIQDVELQIPDYASTENLS